MSEFFNPNDKGGSGTVYSEPPVQETPPINIVVSEGVRTCPGCGNVLGENDAFCGKCGTAMRDIQSSYDAGSNVTQSRHQQPNGVIQTSYPQGGGLQNTAQPTAFDTRTQGTQFGQTPVINNYYYNNNSGNTLSMNNTVNGGRVKDKYVALLLCFFLGWLGVHRYYEGKILSGILYTLTFGIGGIGWLIDLLILLFKPRYYNP